MKAVLYFLVVFSPTDFYVIEKEEVANLEACEQKAKDVVPIMNMAVMMDNMDNNKETTFEIGYFCQ